MSSRKLEISKEHFMGTIKDRNGMDLTEAEAIKERWQEYCTKQNFMTQIMMMV